QSHVPFHLNSPASENGECLAGHLSGAVALKSERRIGRHEVKKSKLYLTPASWAFARNNPGAKYLGSHELMKRNAREWAQSYRGSRRHQGRSWLRSQDIAEWCSVDSRGITVKPAGSVTGDPYRATNFELQDPACPCSSISPTALGYEFLQRAGRRYFKGSGCS